MADTPSLRARFSFSYRGDTKEWSTRFHFTGNAAPTDAEWAAFAADMQTDLVYCMPSYVTLIGYTGYLAGSEVPVWSEAVSVAGTLDTDSTDDPTPGDCAALIRWGTTQRTSKNHPVYLFNYFHGALREASTRDQLSLNQKNALETFAAHFLAGDYSDGTNVLHRAGPHGAVAQDRTVEQYVTHRDFPR